MPRAPPVRSFSVVTKMATAVANPSVPTRTPSVSRSAISHPMMRPARAATTTPNATEIRNGQGSPNGQSALIHSTPNAYMPMPQKPTTPKLAILASPNWRWRSNPRPITITTKNSPEIRNASSQPRSTPLDLPRLGQAVAAQLQDDHEDDDQGQLGVEHLAELQCHGCQRHPGADAGDDDATDVSRAGDQGDKQDEEELLPPQPRPDRGTHPVERTGEPAR